MQPKTNLNTVGFNLIVISLVFFFGAKSFISSSKKSGELKAPNLAQNILLGAKGVSSKSGELKAPNWAKSPSCSSSSKNKIGLHISVFSCGPGSVPKIKKSTNKNLEGWGVWIFIFSTKCKCRL